MRRPRARVCFLVLALGSLGFQSSRPATTQPVDWRFRILGEQVLETVRRRFYDAEAADRWCAKHRDYALAATDRAEFTRLTREALADLKVSHLAYYTPDDPQYWAMLAIFGEAIGHGRTQYEGIGVDVDENGFVRVVFGASPAAAARLRRGDQILAVDGEAFHPVKSFRRKAGIDVVLTVRRRAGAEPITLTVRPRRIHPAREWLEHQRLYSRLMKRGEKRIAYVPMFCGAGEEYEHALRHALGTELKDADALVLDFRYGWGGCGPSFVDIFHERRPAITNITREGRTEDRDRPWTKPVYVLTGPGTRSGKELVCHALQKHGRATLIGAPTAGAVLGASPFPMRDGALLLLPVTDVLVDGQRLEGKPIKPDVAIEDRIAFADGADPVLDAALELARRGEPRAK